MDHHDWADWGDDQPNHGEADTADLNHPDEPIGGLDDFGAHAVHDTGGELDDDAYPASSDGGDDIGHRPDLAESDDPTDRGRDRSGHDGYPEDDPFGQELGDAEAGPGGDSRPAADGAGLGHDAPNTGDDANPYADDSPHDHGGEPAAEPVVGADPDLDPRGDDSAWHDHEFPPPLDLDHVPAPVDGYPWSDPGSLGSGVDDAGHLNAGWTEPNPGDLLDYAGMSSPAGGDPWQALLGSDDPAASALARWWVPGS